MLPRLTSLGPRIVRDTVNTSETDTHASLLPTVTKCTVSCGVFPRPGAHASIQVWVFLVICRRMVRRHAAKWPT